MTAQPGRVGSRIRSAILLLALAACSPHARPRPANENAATSSPFFKADSLRKLGRAGAALPLYRRLADSLAIAGDSTGLWKATLWLGYCHMREGHPDTAGVLLRRSLGLALARRDSVAEGYSRSILSNFLDIGGALDSALGHATRAHAIAASTGDTDLLMVSANALGRIYVASARYRDALVLHREDLELRRRLSGDTGDAYAFGLNEICIDYKNLGRYAEATDACGRSLAIGMDHADTDRIGRAMLNLGTIYDDLGDLERAESLYTGALGYYRAFHNVRGMTIANGNLGGVYLAGDNADSARASFRREGALGRSAGMVDGILDEPLNLASVDLADHRGADAAREARVALRVADSLGYARERVNALILLSAALGQLHQPQEALRRAEEAIRLADSLDVLRLKVDARKARAAARRGLGQRAALDDYLGAIGILESWRGRLALGDLAAGVTNPHLDAFEGAIETLFSEGRSIAAFGIAERARARVLQGLMGDHGMRAEALGPRDSVIHALRAAHAEREDAPPQRQAALDGEIDRLLDSLATLDKDDRSDRAADMATIRSNLLGPDRGLLAYFWGDSAVYGWWFGPDSSRSARLGTPDSLAALLDFLRETLTPAPGQARDDSAWRAPARRAWQRLVAPLHPDSTGTVVVIADGPLARIPFEVLVPPGSDRPLGASHQFIYGPSASVLLTLRRSPPTGPWPRAVLALGNPWLGGSNPDARRPGIDPVRSAGEVLAPLPYAQEEAEAIARIFRAEGGDLLTGRDASEERWRALEPGRYRYLHFAVHALVHERQPERSGLLLSGSELDVASIQHLNLSAALVTLSACKTGLGRTVRGEGIIGLPYAFLSAGARGVVVSLWPVTDRSTADFMTEFYRDLHGGATPGAALLEVRRRWIAGEGTRAHPSRWAAFVLVGGVGGER